MTTSTRKTTMRFTTHNNPSGTWCRWSYVEVNVPDNERDTYRCPFLCPDSHVEEANQT